jgi:hypothetical protein
MTPDQWRQAVTTARAIGDAGQRAVAMTGLAQAAVSDAGIAVVQAGQSDGRMTNPVDYQEAPTLNFDEALNGKNRWSGAHRGSAVPVGTNAGYNFHDGAHGYAVIGPNALNPASPAVTRQYAQHELSLVSTPQQAGVSANQRELVQWTADFRAYFHAYLTIPLPQRPAWHPLLQYYEADDVSDAARRTAVQQLVDYHAHPPADAAEAEDIRRQIRHWISRNGTRALAVALRAALPSP